jgi:hypothetical protein
MCLTTAANSARLPCGVPKLRSQRGIRRFAGGTDRCAPGWMTPKTQRLTVATLCVFGTQADRLFVRTTFLRRHRSFAFAFHEVRARRGEAPCQTRFGVRSLGLIWDSRCLFPKQKPPIPGVFRGADDGTRTHDLLHGKSQRCSHGFAPVRSNRLSTRCLAERANATEPERTPNLAILATPRCLPGRARAPSRMPGLRRVAGVDSRPGSGASKRR